MLFLFLIIALWLCRPLMWTRPMYYRPMWYRPMFFRPMPPMGIRPMFRPMHGPMGHHGPGHRW